MLREQGRGEIEMGGLCEEGYLEGRGVCRMESWLRTSRSGGVSWSRKGKSLVSSALTPYFGKRGRRRSLILECLPEQQCNNEME